MDGLWGDVRLLQVPLQKHALLGSEVLHDVNTKEHDAHHFLLQLQDILNSTFTYFLLSALRD